MKEAIDMTDVKAKLRNLREHMPDAEDVLCDFAAGLADRLRDKMMPSAFALVANLFLYDLRQGKSGFQSKPIPARLCGYPPVMYAAIGLSLKSIARAVFPPDAAAEAVAFIELVEAA
jgi:hypothetical protein